MTNHEQLWYLGYNYLRNVVNCWIKLLITIHMCYLGYNYLRNVDEMNGPVASLENARDFLFQKNILKN